MVKDNSCGIAPLQDKMLEIMKVFDEICIKEGFRYYLAGGSCLGALRHKGFIPWDDDLDVYMPREDYEKFWSLYGTENRINGKYRLCRTSLNHNYHHRVIQMTNLDTTFVHARCINDDIEHGIYIDIIPLDACPNGKLARFSQFIHAIFFSIYNIQCKPEYNGGKMTALMNIGTTILLGLVRSQKMRTRIWKRAERKMTRWKWEDCSHVKCITSQFHELCTAFPKTWFGERRLPFEDMEAVVPSDAESYCKAMYGDYMALPPKDKQVVRHNTVFIDLEHPYTQYKGKYYCTGA